jgi:hypothetical protein
MAGVKMFILPKKQFRGPALVMVEIHYHFSRRVVVQTYSALYLYHQQ